MKVNIPIALPTLDLPMFISKALLASLGCFLDVLVPPSNRSVVNPSAAPHHTQYCLSRPIQAIDALMFGAFINALCCVKTTIGAVLPGDGSGLLYSS